MPTVKLYANLRKIADRKEISIKEDALNSVLNGLVQQYPVLEEAIMEDGQIRSHLIFTINGMNAPDMDMLVSESDEIAIFPPIAGG